MATQGVIVQTSECTRSDGQSSDDPMKLQTSNSPPMTLVTVLLLETNYLTWSRSIRCALATKNKLGSINSTVLELEGEPEKGAWKRADRMVTAWIINSISKDIVETFVYSPSARMLWMDLVEQFGGSNGP